MLPNSLFKLPFCIKTSSNIFVIKTVLYVSAKASVIVLPWGWGFKDCLHMIFCPGAVVRQPFLPGGGDFPLSKKIPSCLPRGDVNSWN